MEVQSQELAGTVGASRTDDAQDSLSRHHRIVGCERCSKKFPEMDVGRRELERGIEVECKGDAGYPGSLSVEEDGDRRDSARLSNGILNGDTDRTVIDSWKLLPADLGCYTRPTYQQQNST
jgi:hypothetical protein